MQMQKWQMYILNIVLALTFWAMAVKAFAFPDEISEVINNSLVFNDILNRVPVQFIGLHDAVIGILLIFRILPKVITTWAAIWVSIVMTLLISSMNAEGLLDAFEHLAPLGIALFLRLNAFTPLILPNLHPKSFKP